MGRTTDMTTGNSAKHILRFAVPLIFTNLGQQLYMIADAAIVGRGVGVKALAAVGSADWIYWLILWTVMALTQGFSTFVSRHFGNHDYRRVNKTIAMSTLLCLMIGGTLTAAGLLATRPLLTLLKTPTDIADGAAIYLITMISGTLVVTAYNMAASILRAFGDSRSPLVAMIISAILNIGLDLLFVLVFDWKIFGAALASVLSQLASFIYCLIRIRRIDCVRLDRSAWKWDGKTIKELLGFGVPLALQSIVIALGGIIVQSTINLQGSMFVAGYTAVNKLYGLLESSAISVGMACSIFLSQNFGAGNYKRVKEGMRTSLIIVMIISAVLGTAALLADRPLLQIFLDTSNAGSDVALEVGENYLFLMCICMPILYSIHIFRNGLQSIGISVWSMISGIAEFIVRVGLAKAVILWCGTNTLFFVEPSAWFSAFLVLALPYFVNEHRLLKNPAQFLKKQI